MKKALVVLLILAVAGGLFAQEFSLNGRVDAWLVPFQYIDRDGDSLVGAGLGRDTNGGNGVRARLFGEAKTDTMGLKIQLQFYPADSTAAVQFDDNVELWWKPIDWFQLDVGKFVSDPLRGKIGDGSWMDGVTVMSYDGDEIFSRFKSQGLNNGGSGNAGVLASFNYGGLFVGALLPNLAAFGAAARDPLTGGKANVYETAKYGNGSPGNGGGSVLGREFERIQFAVGYTIPDIGLVRVQYVGANAGLSGGIDFSTPSVAAYTIYTPRIEAAFALTMIDGLTLDIGGKVPLPLKADQVDTWTGAPDYKWDSGTGDWKAQAPYQLSVGATYKANSALTITGRVDGKFGGSVDSGVSGQEPIKFGPEINFHLFPTYDIGIVVLGLDFGLGWYGSYTYDGDVIGSSDVPLAGYSELNGGVRAGGGIYAQKTWGGSTIRGGLAYKAGTKVNGVKEDAVFSVPIVFEYSF
jgi:hypothetical protein